MKKFVVTCDICGKQMEDNTNFKLTICRDLPVYMGGCAPITYPISQCRSSDDSIRTYTNCHYTSGDDTYIDICEDCKTWLTNCIRSAKEKQEGPHEL